MSEAIISVSNLGKKYPSGLDAPTGRKRISHSPTPLPARRFDAPEGSLESDREWVVYAIENAVERIYVGQTGDWEARLKSHNNGLVRSTQKDGPWRLVAMEKCATQSEARWLEFQIKRSRGKRIKWVKQQGICNER